MDFRAFEMQTLFILDRSPELVLLLQQLTLSMKQLDHLGLPLAAAYLDMAINTVRDEIEPAQLPVWISLENELDFSSLDKMIDSVFLTAR